MKITQSTSAHDISTFPAMILVKFNMLIDENVAILIKPHYNWSSNSGDIMKLLRPICFLSLGPGRD